MLKPLIKIARYGSIVEEIRFEKPLIVSGRRHPTTFKRKNRSPSSVKLIQNIRRTKRRIRRVVSICTQMIGNPAFATFTYREPQHNMQTAIEDWRQFTRTMKRHYPDVAFLRVPERHKSGAVHFHAVIYGLPHNLPCMSKKIAGRWKHSCPWNRNCERKQRLIAKAWKKGFVDVQVTRSPESIGAYVAKYLTKGDPDWTLFGNHVASCNQAMYAVIRSARKAGVYWELSSYSSPRAVKTAIADLLDRMQLKYESTFQTQWLGEARYTVSTIKGP